MFIKEGHMNLKFIITPLKATTSGAQKSYTVSDILDLFHSAVIITS